MAIKYANTMLVQMKLIDEAASVVVDSYRQGLISIDDLTNFNEKYVEGLYQVLHRPGGTTGGVSNPGVVVSEISEANLQGMVYYIKNFKRIRRTYKHANV